MPMIDRSIYKFEPSIATLLAYNLAGIKFDEMHLWMYAAL